MTALGIWRQVFLTLSKDIDVDSLLSGWRSKIYEGQWQLSYQRASFTLNDDFAVTVHTDTGQAFITKRSQRYTPVHREIKNIRYDPDRNELRIDLTGYSYR